jgi:hypothetical protein
VEHVDEAVEQHAAERRRDQRAQLERDEVQRVRVERRRIEGVHAEGSESDGDADAANGRPAHEARDLLEEREYRQAPAGHEHEVEGADEGSGLKHPEDRQSQDDLSVVAPVELAAGLVESGLGSERQRVDVPGDREVAVRRVHQRVRYRVRVRDEEPDAPGESEDDDEAEPESQSDAIPEH